MLPVEVQPQALLPGLSSSWEVKVGSWCQTILLHDHPGVALENGVRENSQIAKTNVMVANLSHHQMEHGFHVVEIKLYMTILTDEYEDRATKQTS